MFAVWGSWRLYRMISSENRLPLFGIMGSFTHDLVRKP
ncbi:MAG: hypothetical protein RLZZ496_758, partial [Pseudomonadota bacterium]